jgi:hypothetical protein
MCQDPASPVAQAIPCANDVDATAHRALVRMHVGFNSIVGWPGCRGYRLLFPFDAPARSFARGCSFRGLACSAGGAFTLRMAMGVSKNALRAFSNESSVIGLAGLIMLCTPFGTQLTATDCHCTR